ncbi:TetR/AcrR family transcriptional regulator (plasmid) [Aliirhizobium terrae]|uniref:TetR/AcrR family transcriptional regulator n=1 Tax=Terrirhizobium terrae TaxID=2926709 RepID=UPI0025774F08|nr:TetR/AcrR family transcriptional regulator [Rhizobium sp. CC-CFT758]WJH38439.1 TetR/AcrR family transcriptional regulator [Rhizobium sp. CC-CFT758]
MRKAPIGVFARNGFNSTKVSDIVAEAGLSQPSFYLYFESKEATYESLVEEFREDLRRVTLSNLIDPYTTQEALEAQVAISFRTFHHFMAADRALTEIGFFQPPGCSIAKQQMVGWVASNHREEQSNGIFRPGVAADEMARVLVGMIDQFARIDANAERTRLAGVCAKMFFSGAFVL